MPARKKRGHATVVSPSTGKEHGRPLPTAPAVRLRPSIDGRDARVRLVEALMLRVLRRAGCELVPIKERALKQRVDRARKDLGIEVASRLTRAFAETSSPLLSTVRKAHHDLRDYAARAAIRFAILADEHAVQSHAALVLLGSSAQWSALGELLRDGAFKVGAEVLTQSQTIKSVEGTMTASGPAFGDLLKLATSADNTARLNLLAALQIERESRDARQNASPLAGDLNKRLEAMLRERSARQLTAPSVLDTTAEDETANAPPEPSASEETADDEPVQDAPTESKIGSSIADAEPTKQPPATETSIMMQHPAAAIEHARQQSQLAYEPKLRAVVTKGDRERLAKDGSRPSPYALEEMKRRGIDVSNWEREGEPS